jgi:hypothetical protein
VAEKSTNISKTGSRNSDEVWCDNQSAISIANNPMQHDRTKHVEIDRFFIKEKLDNELLGLSHIATGEQVADWAMNYWG